jgi:Rrf2 family protein
MPTSTRFAVAVHILAILAAHEDCTVRSEALAQSVCTNPTVIRRLLCLLAEAGLTQSQLGYGGGTTLAKPAEQITLLDVFQTVEDPNLFEIPRNKPNQDCPIGCSIQDVLGKSTHKAQQALEAELAKTTIAQVAHEIQKHTKLRKR